MSARTVPVGRLVEHVLDLAALGLSVFPLRPNDKRPAVSDWEQRATTDPGRIRRCWSHASYGVGIACGPSGLVVVDLDTAKGEAPPAPGVHDGADMLAVLYEAHGDRYPISTTPEARTGSGGTHLYYRAPQGRNVRNSAGRVGWRIDVRAAGGYVVAPPSTAAGRPYTWVTAPWTTEPAPLPGWLATLAGPKPVTTRPMKPVTVRDATGYAAAALRAEVQRVLDSRPGTRNNELVSAAFSLGQLAAGGALPAALAIEALVTAGHSTGLPLPEVEATVTRGMTAGAKHPRSSA
ncbi:MULTISPECIES: bifunctional DNA primase/polymerase [Streptomyces]|uniref:bifunctional DNA primase/polymerase n=1 Tax=Streptomyces TaxID=1883 RepID=UPI0030DEC7D0